MATADPIPVAHDMDDVVNLLIQLVTQLTSNTRSSQLTDTRGIGKPTDFHGYQVNYKEWLLKLDA